MNMNFIQARNDYCTLYCENPKIFSKFYRALRHPQRGYYHSTLYKQGRWDGHVDFLSKKTGKFLTGLLPEVTTGLKLLGEEYKIKDERGQIEWGIDEINEEFLPGMDLYDYQVDLINQAIRHSRGVIFAPTSAGKTAIMIGIMKALPPKTPTLFLANRKGLVEQNYQEMMDWGFENVGRLYDKHKNPDVITCATVQSLHKIEKILPHFKVLIVDEIHDMMSKQPKKFYNKLKGANVRIAVSATPFKFGGKDKVQKYNVKGYFGPVFQTDAADNPKKILTTELLQNREILSASDCTFYNIDEPNLPYAVYQEAVTKGIAESLFFHETVRDLAVKQKGRTLILVERIAHGDALSEMIPGALWVQGKDDLETRQFVIDKLKKAKGNVVAIATQGIFNAGINVFIHNLINAAGGKAEHIIIQRMGRGLRTADDKEVLRYYDFIFNINDYLLMHSRKRMRILKKEGHKVIIKEKFDF
tara:strand:+ start:1057 stop:2472 length:1416 start_codon:yes stop_codon:yes gene_type:complete